MESYTEGTESPEPEAEAGRGEFNGYTFARTASGSLIELNKGADGARVFLVFHHRSRRLARLHILEGLAVEGQGSESRFDRFMEIMGRLSESDQTGRRPGNLLSFGCEEEEGYYGQAYVDGEPLILWLKRQAAIPPGVVLSLVASLTLEMEERAGGAILRGALDAEHLRVASVQAGRGLILTEDDFSNWSQGCETDEVKWVEDLGWLAATLLHGSRPDHLGEVKAAPDEAGLGEALLDLCRCSTGSRRREGGPVETLAQWSERVARLGAMSEAGGTIPQELKPGSSLMPRLLSDESRPVWGKAFQEWNILDSMEGTVEPGLLLPTDPTEAKQVFGLRVLPGSQWVPREAWLPQQRSSLMAGDRRASYRLRMKPVADEPGVMVLAEEAVEGISLEELVLVEGGLEVDVVLAAIRRVALALVETEKKSLPIWHLDPSDVLFGFDLGRFRAADDRVALFVDCSLHLRLHPTVSTWLRGVELPDSFEAAMQSAPSVLRQARHSANALSLSWFALSGRRMSWEAAGEADDGLGQLPAGLATLLHETRERILENPEGSRGKFLRRFMALAEGGGDISSQASGASGAIGLKGMQPLQEGAVSPFTKGVPFSVEAENANHRAKEPEEAEGREPLDSAEVEFSGQPRDLGLFQQAQTIEKDDDVGPGEAGMLFPTRSLHLGEGSFDEGDEGEHLLEEEAGEAGRGEEGPGFLQGPDMSGVGEGSMAALLREAEERRRLEGPAQPPRDRGRLIKWVLLVLLLGLGIGVGLWWYLGRV